ncbi:hypothetical protein TNCV_4401651 [Trichonephila clavipes]|nr:hypothetical protein TNCV_4401651 [Trichonephila clavipes]
MTRFRKHKYAFTTDIQMMFRQILIDPAQGIFSDYVENRSYVKPVIYGRLKTVTLWDHQCSPFSYTNSQTVSYG